jgi:hypothetical protein
MRYQKDLSEKEINENIEGTIEQYAIDTFFTYFFCKNLNYFFTIRGTLTIKKTNFLNIQI